MSLDNLSRSAYTDDHEAFRATVRQFLEKEVAPNAAQWAEDKIVPKSIWPKAGELGMLCPTVPEEYGGLGLDFGYNAIVDEESAYYGRATTGFSLQSDIVTNYIVKYGSEEQKKHWLPKMVSGEVITAIAMTEPGTGSDLQGMRTTAKKDGNHYVINGSKTYITNGQNADLILVCRQDRHRGAAGVEGRVDRPRRGRPRRLSARPQARQDRAGRRRHVGTVLRRRSRPDHQLPGRRGQGFHLSDEPAAAGTAVDRGQRAGLGSAAFDDTVEFTKRAQGVCKPMFDFQNTRFVLADLKTKLQVGWAHLDWAITRHLKKRADQRRRAPRRSCGTPTCNGKSWTNAFSCMAARAI
jgi:acyl-CoA dehydrogenase